MRSQRGKPQGDAIPLCRTRQHGAALRPPQTPPDQGNALDQMHRLTRSDGDLSFLRKDDLPQHGT
uniref:Uncharacterized protein n=1 Tax=Sulfitobacter sp. DFL14 TaxID=1179815 RepID=I3W0N0_9RHOB|nr:hypothetical protein [Sulfitobacter sp. DFL14]